MIQKIKNVRSIRQRLFDLLNKRNIYFIGIIFFVLILTPIMKSNGNSTPFDKKDNTPGILLLSKWISLDYNSCKMFDVVHEGELGNSKWWQDKNGQLHATSDNKNVSMHFIYQKVDFERSVDKLVLLYGPGNVFLTASDGGLASHIVFYIWDKEPVPGTWGKPSNYIWENGRGRTSNVNSYSWASDTVSISLPNPTRIIYFGMSTYDPWGDVSVNVNINYLKIKPVLK
jgi:hypothetical protein